MTTFYIVLSYLVAVALGIGGTVLGLGAIERDAEETPQFVADDAVWTEPVAKLPTRTELLGIYAHDHRISSVSVDGVTFADGRLLGRVSERHVWRLYDQRMNRDERYWYGLHGPCAALDVILGQPQTAAVSTIPNLTNKETSC